jgi:predicted esterase
MRSALLSLHGFTMNGPSLRRHLGELEPRLSKHVDLVFPNAPHTASEASVLALLQRMGGTRSAPPQLEWWNASDDGRVYQGWEATRESLRTEVLRHPAAGLLGFSQGAAVAAAVAALACRGAFPPLSFVVLVAGFAPRSAELLPLLDEPLTIPSLHIWGQDDAFAKHGPGLASKFSSLTRRIVTWKGGHSVPASGDAADAIVEFVRNHAADVAAFPPGRGPGDAGSGTGGAPPAGHSDEGA